MSMIASLLGDDEHTARDDAYVRTMKSRKWVAVAACACIGAWASYFTPAEFSIGIGKVVLDENMWKKITLYGITYAFLQYSFLIIQLFGKYPLILSERFGERQFEKYKENLAKLEIALAESAALRGDPSAQMRVMASGGADHFIRPDILADSTREKMLEAIDARITQLQSFNNDLPDHKPNIAYRISEMAIDALRLGAPIAMTIIAFGTILKN